MQLRALVQNRQPGREALRGRKLGKLLAAVFAKHPDGVGAALVAVGHLRHHFSAPAAGGGKRLCVRLRLAVEAKHRAVLRPGDQRHNIMDKRAAGPQRAAHVGHAAIVDPGDQHRIYFHQHALCGQPAHALQLTSNQNLSRFASAVALAVQP